MTAWCENKRVLVEEQAGFRAHRHCADHMLSLVEIIRMRKRKHLPTFCAFIDLRKAYDRVMRNGLWLKLAEAGVHGRMFRVLHQMYDEVWSAVLVDDVASDWFKLRIGLRQGCVLSPLLFDIFINGVANDLNVKGLGVPVDASLRLSILLFADDLVLIASTPGDLQRMLDEVSQYCSKWRSDVNLKKTEVVIFGDPRKPVPQFFLHGVALKVVKSYKYLGLDVYVSLRWTQMRSRLYAKARAKVASAFGMANCAHVLNVEFGIQLWKSIVRPILEYGCEIWGDSTWKQGEELQKLVAKRILRCPMNMADEAALGELGFWTLKARSDMLRLRYWGELINMSLERIPKCVYNASKRVFEHELRHLLFRPPPVFVGTEREQKQQQRAYLAPVVHARQTNWCFCTFELLQRYGLDQYWDSEDVGRSWHRQVFKAVQMVEEREWRARMELKPKLRTYRRLKSKLKCEQYLVRSDGEKRVYDLFKLRCGTNLLRVDTAMIV